jgi:prepilin-type N-terminal cleavage/methylation domain-containing protein
MMRCFRPGTNNNSLSVRHGPRGFTLIEILVVLIAMGILAAGVVYVTSLPSDTALVSGTDQVVADIQYAQMRAMGIGTSQSVSFTAGSAAYAVAGEPKTLPPGTAAGNTVIFTFNSLGEPTAGGGSTLMLNTAGGTRGLTVTAVTGEIVIS